MITIFVRGDSIQRIVTIMSPGVYKYWHIHKEDDISGKSYR